MNTNKHFAKTAKFLSVLGFVLVLVPLIYAFAAAGEPKKGRLVFSVAAPFIFVALGYLLQAVVSKVSGYKQKEPTFDDGVKYIELSACILSLVICIASALPLTALYKAYVMSVEKYIDPYALYLYLPPVICVAMMAAGVILWFYPYHKLMYAQTAYGYGAAFLIIMLISAIFGVSLVPITACLALFLGIFFTVINLRSIEESLSTSKFRVPSNNFRSYNLKLTLKHYLVTVVIALLAFCLLMLLIGAINPDINLDPKDTEDKSVVYADNGASTPSSKGLITAFFTSADSNGISGIMKFSMLMVVGAFLIFVLWWIYRKHLFKKFFGTILLLFRGIGDFIDGLLLLFEGKVNEDIPQSYVDTEKDIDCFVEYREYRIKEELTRQSFELNLEAKGSLEEKYAYAYSVYTRLIRGHKYGVKASDTPRMITAKLSAQHMTELVDATPVYEDIRYRTVKPKPNICERELNELVALIKEIL